MARPNVRFEFGTGLADGLGGGGEPTRFLSSSRPLRAAKSQSLSRGVSDMARSEVLGRLGPVGVRRHSTQSTSSSTGSLIVTGGMGVAKDVHVAGDINSVDVNTTDVNATGNVYAPGTWTLISTTTASSDTSIDIALTGTYTRYRLEVVGILFNTDANGENFCLRVSEDGGTTFKTNAYGWVLQRVLSGGASAIYDQSATDSTIIGLDRDVYGHDTATTRAGRGLSCTVEIKNPHSSTTTTFFDISTQSYNGGNWVLGKGAAQYTGHTSGVPNTIDYIRIMLDGTGDMVSGELNLYAIGD